MEGKQKKVWWTKRNREKMETVPLEDWTLGWDCSCLHELFAAGECFQHHGCCCSKRPEWFAMADGRKEQYIIASKISPQSFLYTHTHTHSP